MATYRLTCSGNTRPWKEALKKSGWKWDADGQSWYMMLVEAHAQRIIDGDVEFFRGLGGHKKGCRLTLDGIVRWTSKTYEMPTTTPAKADGRDADQDGFGWNCDANGNPVATTRISGSCPDDCV